MISLLCARYCSEADVHQCNPLLGQEQIDTPYLEYTGEPVYNETTVAAAGNYTPLSLYVVCACSYRDFHMKCISQSGDVKDVYHAVTCQDSHTVPACHVECPADRTAALSSTPPTPSGTTTANRPLTSLTGRVQITPSPMPNLDPVRKGRTKTIRRRRAGPARPIRLRAVGLRLLGSLGRGFKSMLLRTYCSEDLRKIVQSGDERTYESAGGRAHSVVAKAMGERVGMKGLR